MPSVRKLPPEEIQHAQGKGTSQRQRVAVQYDALLADFAAGDWGDAFLDESENRVTVRARLVAAALRRGLRLSFKRAQDGRLRFEVGPAADGAPAPLRRRGRPARQDGPQQDAAPDEGFVVLFDGSADAWRMSTISHQPPGRNYPGRVMALDDRLEAQPGNDIGLYWCSTPTPPDFMLTLEWLRHDHQSRSGVLLRFPDPSQKGYNNTAYVAVDFGFKVQIGGSDGADGAIYGKAIQALTPQLARPAGQWNRFEIRVEGQTYTVWLNGAQVTQFHNDDPGRGLPSAPDAPSFIGLQLIPGQHLAFRHIRIKSL